MSRRIVEIIYRYRVELERGGAYFVVGAFPAYTCLLRKRLPKFILASNNQLVLGGNLHRASMLSFYVERCVMFSTDVVVAIRKYPLGENFKTNYFETLTHFEKPN
jgi:hypothetical protein